MYDLIIVGAGPAGISAAVYAARKKINTLVVSKDIGGQPLLSAVVENYIGYQFITGAELVEKFSEHIRQYNLNVKEGEEVVSIEKTGDGVIRVKTSKNQTHESKTVIIASGKKPRPLNVTGEEEFKNRGVTYCATCDAPLFSGKDVAVVGGGNSALDATLQLMKIANRIYLVNLDSKLGGDAVMREKVEASDKVVVLNSSRTAEILGDRFVNGIVVDVNGERKTFSVQGIFIEIGLIPNSGLIKNVEKNQLGEIKVDCRCQTNVEGIFAAGDVTDVPEKQIIIAAGEGAKAALGVFRYLSRQR